MSDLSSAPIKVIVQIAMSLIEGEFDYKNPYSDIDESEEILSEKAAWTGIKTDSDDVEFISEFIKLNLDVISKIAKKEVKFSEVSGSFNIPQSQKFRVYYSVWGSAVYTEEYYTIRESYDASYAKRSIQREYYDGSWDYWDGERLDDYADNFDADNFEITGVEDLNESKKTVLDKLVLENTSEVLDNLDKDTLIELRNLINQRLSSF